MIGSCRGNTREKDIHNNGQLAEFFSMVGQDLFYTKKDYDSQPYSTPNPFFYPICFLVQATGGYEHELKLPYIQSQAAMDSLLANIKPDPDASDNQVSGLLPKAGILGGLSFEYRVVFGSKISYLPTRIDIVLLDKVHNPDRAQKPGVVNSIEILDYGSQMVVTRPQERYQCLS